MNIFREMGKSVISPDYYPNFLKNRKGKVFLFGALLMLIFYLCTAGVMAFSLYFSTGGYQGFIRNEVPEFTLRDGKLTLDQVYHRENDSIYIDMNTAEDHHVSEDDKDVREALALKNIVVIGDSERAVVQGVFGSGPVMMDYKRLELLDADKTWLLKQQPMVDMMIGFFILASYIGFLGVFFLEVLITAWLGSFLARRQHLNLHFGQIFTLSVYTKVLPLVIELIFYYLPFDMTWLTFVPFIVSLSYLARVFRGMKESGTNFGGGTAGPAAQQPFPPAGDYSFRNLNRGGWFGTRANGEPTPMDPGRTYGNQVPPQEPGHAPVERGIPENPVNGNNGAENPAGPNGSGNPASGNPAPGNTVPGNTAPGNLAAEKRNAGNGNLTPSNGWSFGSHKTTAQTGTASEPEALPAPEPAAQDHRSADGSGK